jgi:hypothetical protein
VQAKHVSIVIKQAWNVRNYGYVGDVSPPTTTFSSIAAIPSSLFKVGFRGSHGGPDEEDEHDGWDRKTMTRRGEEEGDEGGEAMYGPWIDHVRSKEKRVESGFVSGGCCAKGYTWGDSTAIWRVEAPNCSI